MPKVTTELQFGSVFQLLVATLLSAQCTDKRINQVTPALFRQYPDAASMAKADETELFEYIKSVSYPNAKARHLAQMARMLVDEYDGEVPTDFNDLVRLPGVGRKTANIVLNKAFGIVEGIAVDTHVFRLATRWKLTNKPTPLQAEQDLLAVIPQELWAPVNEQWIHFGRDVCRAQHPLCDGCPLADICPSFGKADGNPKPQARRRTTKKKEA